MIGNFATTIIAVLIMSVTNSTGQFTAQDPKNRVIGQKQFSMRDRYPVESVNEVMKKNILLDLAYMNGIVTKKSEINWDKITSAFHFEKTLKPGQVFAFHDIVRGEYSDKVAFTSNSHFNASDGYVSDGYLFGDGVCDLASLINWAALDASLTTFVPKDHRSVAQIPGIPDEYGVSIYANPTSGAGSNNNLYVTNDKDHEVKFHFDFDGVNLKVSITENT